MRQLITLTLLTLVLAACGQSNSSGIDKRSNSITITITNLNNPSMTADHAIVNYYHPFTEIITTESIRDISFIEADNCLLNRGVKISDLDIQPNRVIFQYRDSLNQPLTNPSILNGCVLQVNINLN